MNNINVLLDNLETTILQLGRVGENEHTQIRINCISIFSDYPNATVAMTVLPPQGEAYPKVITRSGVMVSWVVLDSDLVADGSGQIQLTFTNDNEIIKTVIGNTQIMPSLEPTGDVPTPIENWIDTANETLAEFQTDVTDIRRITTAEAGDEGKVLSAKTVTDGKVTEWDYVDVADPDVITQAVDDWLDDHPEATTTVQDGAITEPKLNDSLKDALAWQSDVDGLMSAINQSKAPTILDNASGEIVTIPDGADGLDVKTLTVEIEPKQDLHGQANPYPAGGGKNKFTIPNYSGSTYGNVTYSFDPTTNTLSKSGTSSGSSGTNVGEITLAEGTYTFSASFSNETGSSTAIYLRDKSTSTNVAYISAGSPTATVQLGGTYYVRLSTTAGATGGTIANIQLESGSSKTAFAPYSNLCPISGWSAAEVVRTGKNLFIANNMEQGSFDSGTGAKSANNTRIRTNKQIWLKAGRYVLSNSSNLDVVMYIYDRYGNFMKSETYTGWTSNPFSIILANDRYVAFAFRYSDNANILPSALTNPMLVAGTEQAAYTEEGIAVSYTFPTPPGTVYGGTLTVNADGTGQLVVDEYLYVYDGTETFYKSGTALNGFYNDLYSGITPHNWPKIRYITSISDEISSMFIATSSTDTYKNNYGYVYFDFGHNFSCDPAIFGSTVDSFKAKLAELYAAGTPVSVFCKILQPVTYNLTSLEVVELLKGVNNLWADCGNVSIEYPCDTKLYVDKKIMEAIANALNA